MGNAALMLLMLPLKAATSLGYQPKSLDGGIKAMYVSAGITILAGMAGITLLLRK